MEKKKTKLTISGNPRKSIDNIEIARLQNKNSVVIEKKSNRFTNNSSSRRNLDFKPKFKQNSPSSEALITKKPHKTFKKILSSILYFFPNSNLFKFSILSIFILIYLL